MLQFRLQQKFAAADEYKSNCVSMHMCVCACYNKAPTIKLP